MNGIFVTPMAGTGTGTTVAVKDCIAVAGVPSTAGCRAVADRAKPSPADAACLVRIRAATASGRARLVGTTTMHELAFGVTGINPWFGTPVNPVAPGRVPGGSSSGSAVAVATRQADVALGTDTGGSIRIPAACCAVAGLKTSAGRVPTAGVRPLAPSLDTVGVLAADAAGLATAMELVEPGFAGAVAAAGTELSAAAPVIGRLRVAAEPAIDAACDGALAAAGLHVVDVALPGWDEATVATRTILLAEAWDVNGDLLRQAPDRLGDDVAARLRTASAMAPAAVIAAERFRQRWTASLERLFASVEALALPTLAGWPPMLDDTGRLDGLRHTLPVNLAGLPAVAVPVAAAGPVPASLQLVGPPGADARLVALAELLG